MKKGFFVIPKSNPIINPAKQFLNELPNSTIKPEYIKGKYMLFKFMVRRENES